MATHRHIELHDCEPTPLQREGLMRRADTYRAWVAAGTVRRVDAEAMLEADARQIGCDVDTDDFLAVQPRPQGPVAARHRGAKATDRDGPAGRAEGPGPLAASARAWR